MNPVETIGKIREMVSPSNVRDVLVVKSVDHATRIVNWKTARGGTKKQQEQARKLLKQIVEVALEWMSF